MTALGRAPAVSLAGRHSTVPNALSDLRASFGDELHRRESQGRRHAWAKALFHGGERGGATIWGFNSSEPGWTCRSQLLSSNSRKPAWRELRATLSFLLMRARVSKDRRLSQRRSPQHPTVQDRQWRWRERKTGLLTKPQPPIQLGSGWQGALRKIPTPDELCPRGRATSAGSECSERFSKFPVLRRKGFTRFKESSRMALQDWWILVRVTSERRVKR